MIKINRGFTIIELLVVIAVIGILATITTIGFSRYQADARDAQRTSKAVVIAEALEKYYDKNGEYPSCAALAKPVDVIISTYLQGIDKSALVTPRANAGSTNSIACQSISSTSDDIFSYTGDGSPTCSTGESCLQWTISYKDEASGEIKTIESRRKGSFSSSGSPVVTGSVSSYSNATINWTPIANSVSYVVQRDTVATFNSGALNEVTVAGTVLTKNYTNGVPNTTYYYRVAAVYTTQGVWSDPLILSVPAFTAPVLTNTTNSTTSFTSSWTAPAFTTSYIIQCSSSSSDFSSAPTDCQATQSGTSFPWSPVAQGTRLYIRVRAVSGTTQSAWSSVVVGTTAIPAPTSASTSTATSATATPGASNGQLTLSWSAVTDAASYKIEYATNSSFTSMSTINGATGTSRAFTGLIQGATYYFRVYAVSASTIQSVSASPVASRLIPIATPSAPSPQFGNSWGNNQYVATNYTTYCPPGTSVYNGNFTSYSWEGSPYYHGFGFVDWWTLGPGGGAYVTYYARYACQGPTTTSAYSPDHGYSVLIHP